MTTVVSMLTLAAAALVLVACGGGDETGVNPMGSETRTTASEGGSAVSSDEADTAAEASDDGADRDRDGETPQTLRQPPPAGDAPPSASADNEPQADQPEAEDDEVRDDDPETPPQVEPSPDTGDGAAADRSSILAGRVVALDPGHNGGNFGAPEEINRLVDAGGFSKACNTTGTATRDGYRESTFNLAVAQLLRARLEAAGAEVHLTRTDDDGVGPCIDLRGTFGQQVGADLTISIHADGAGANARGFHIIHPLSWSGSDVAVLDASRELAVILRDVLVEHGKAPANYVGSDGLVARSDLATLNLSEVPVVLLEIGNLRNVDDAAELLDPRWQAQLADALVDGIERYLGQRIP